MKIKLTPIKQTKIDNDVLCIYDQKQITDDAINRLTKKLNKIIIKGIELKGYSFKDKESLYKFFKERVSKTIDNNQHKYYIDNRCFLIINYTNTINVDYNGFCSSVTAKLCDYMYV